MDLKVFNPERYHTLFPEIEALANNAHQCVAYTGVAGSGDAVLLCTVFKQRNSPIIVFMPDHKTADKLFRECCSFIGAENVALFPSRDAVPYNLKSPFGPTTERRLEILSQLLNAEKKMYIAPAVTLLQRVPSKQELFNHIITIGVNDELSQDQLVDWLQDNGFSRETQIQDIGTYAVRGGIFDIYPFMTDNPVRLEFWGNVVESIREFDVFTQKSVKQRNSVAIFPMKEFCFTEDQIQDGTDTMMLTVEENSKNDTVSAAKLSHKWNVLSDLDGIEWFLHWFDFPFSTLLDYFSPETLLVWNDIFTPLQRFEESLNNYVRHLHQVPENMQSLVSPPEKLLFSAEQILQYIEKLPTLFINTHTFPPEAVTHRIMLQEQPSFAGKVDFLIGDLKKKLTDGYTVTILCENVGHAERLEEQIIDLGPDIVFALGFLANGFVDSVQKIALYTENKILSHSYYLPPIKFKKRKKSLPINSLDSLSVGDYVVHVDHGIARFSGIQRIKASGVFQDCMLLHFQNNAKVYVPIEDFYKVQKYIGKDSAQPTLSKLGSTRWEKLKERTRQSLKEMAEKLVQLYAKRQCCVGIQFSKDSLWQKEFEDSFLFEPTPDQIKSAKDIKKDLESARPMDRLICGDVGFGKTELAMRAAFKAALDGYQAAVLAPTTILAAQHYTTFKERMANFPIRIGVLSRFLTAREQKENLKKLKNGEIDIIIGTHRLLSKDVVFKNLGLLIIDEEQRFGVAHKEKLKEYRCKIDILSMTATPIPRTMHMALAGIRDLSIIGTPPQNRLPVETHVHEYHEEIIKRGIENELERGGQVFIVHNRIRRLYELKETIERNVPRARVTVAHGQMNEKELEMIMKEFVAGRYDVLISTAIIENGLDIPNVNTIIVTRAEIMGLSQLYQLRGRVGRSSEQAYAYFLTAAFNQLNNNALKRLRALEQYTDLGSGFQIAMRDLEIRGAGNILGTDQHGFIAAIGFELYCQLLREEVERIKEHKPDGADDKKEALMVTVDIGLEAYIPVEYIPESATRIEIYQECSRIKNNKEISAIKKSVVDRFGPLPESVEGLLILMSIKLYAQKLGITFVRLDKGTILSLSLPDNLAEIKQRIESMIVSMPHPSEIIYETPLVTLKIALESETILGKALEIKSILEAQMQEKSGN